MNVLWFKYCMFRSFVLIKHFFFVVFSFLSNYLYLFMSHFYFSSRGRKPEQRERSHTERPQARYWTCKILSPNNNNSLVTVVKPHDSQFSKFSCESASKISTSKVYCIHLHLVFIKFIRSLKNVAKCPAFKCHRNHARRSRLASVVNYAVRLCH